MSLAAWQLIRGNGLSTNSKFFECQESASAKLRLDKSTYETLDKK